MTILTKKIKMKKITRKENLINMKKRINKIKLRLKMKQKLQQNLMKNMKLYKVLMN